MTLYITFQNFKPHSVYRQLCCKDTRSLFCSLFCSLFDKTVTFTRLSAQAQEPQEGKSHCFHLIFKSLQSPQLFACDTDERKRVQRFL